MENLRELLTLTKACQSCAGTGQVEDKESTTGHKKCEKCSGAGIEIDNTIADAILKYAPDIKRADLGKCVNDIYVYIGDKLEYAFNRGKEMDNK